MAELADVGKQVSPRFQLVNAVPLTTLVVFVGVVLGSGAWGGRPSYDTLARRVESLGLRELAIAALTILLLGLVTNSFQTRLVKALEGYWAPVGPRLLLLSFGLDRHHELRNYYGVQRADDSALTRWQRFWLNRTPAHRRQQLERAFRRWSAAHHDLYPQEPLPDVEQAQLVLPLPEFLITTTPDLQEDRLMPTALGNTLRRAEDFAGDRFGLDAVALAPYLLAVASADTVAVYEDARLELDVTVRLVYVWLFCSLVSLVALLNDGPWLAVPLLTFWLAWIAYRAAIIAASNFGEVLIQVVDLHRFDLLAKMHWPLPDKVGDEAVTTAPLWRVLGGQAEDDDYEWTYHHGAMTPDATSNGAVKRLD